jgi:hypothetical protein
MLQLAALAAGVFVGTACSGSSDTKTDADADAAVDAGDSSARTMSLRILFIGNSYTYVNDLPSMVRVALASAPEVDSIEVASVTQGGATLGDHWDAGIASTQIRTGHFTHVVVQGQSTEIARYESFAMHSRLFALAVHEAGAELDFFETWPRRAGDPLYSDPMWPYPCPSSMLSAAKAFYRLQARTLGGELAPVGEAWAAVLAAHPEIDLYAADGTHPSIAGSWLAASVLVCTIAHRSAKGLTSPVEISAPEAAVLTETADRACADWSDPEGGTGVYAFSKTKCVDGGPD